MSHNKSWRNGTIDRHVIKRSRGFTAGRTPPSSNLRQVVHTYVPVTMQYDFIPVYTNGRWYDSSTVAMRRIRR